MRVYELFTETLRLYEVANCLPGVTYENEQESSCSHQSGDPYGALSRVCRSRKQLMLNKLWRPVRDSKPGSQFIDLHQFALIRTDTATYENDHFAD